MARILSIPWAMCVLVSLGSAGAAEADGRFAGTWQGTVKTGASSTTLHVVMLPDGTFTTVIASDGDNMRISGTYQVLDGRTIRFVNRDYAPRERCGPSAGGERICTSIDLPAEETDSYAFENGGQTLIIANPDAGEMRFEKVE
jgi:hypothetical protein